MTDDRKKIFTLWDHMYRHVKNKNIEGLKRDVYASDVILMFPSLATGSGHEAVQAAFGAMFEAGVSKVQYHDLVTEIHGDVACSYANYKIHIGGKVVVPGKALMFLKKMNDQWRISHVCHNHGV